MFFEAEEGGWLVLGKCAQISVGFTNVEEITRLHMAVRQNFSPGCLLNTTVVQRKLGESSRFEFWDTRRR